MQPTPGAQLLHYRLAEKLGEGGMGVVWKARDEDLDREVAIKFLTESAVGSQERLARLEREARLLATLNHPGIAQVFGLHTAEGVRFVAMEYVPGETLHQRIRRAPLDADQTIELGLQIAAALEAAHLRGVVHRDLKPANIVVAPDGTAKVLDFGLARADEPAEALPPDLANSPTLTTPGTLAGTLLGTAAYMSPEQARGRPVGREVDLWAFGCVLFECLTGRPAFDGDSVTDTLASVLRNEPDWDALPAEAPPRLVELLKRCLQKDPRFRQRDAGDAALDLAAARLDTTVTAPPALQTRSRRLAWLAVVSALVAVTAFAALWLRPATGPASRTVRAALEIPEGWLPFQVRISPDGSRVGMVARGRADDGSGWQRKVFLRELGSDDEFRPLEGRAETRVLRFSPDSSEILFVADEVAGVDGAALVRAPADGSAPPSLIARWEPHWFDDLVWLSSREVGLIAGGRPLNFLRIPVDGTGGVVATPIALDESRNFYIDSTLPDGTVLGTVESWEGGYHQSVAHVDPATGSVRVLVERGFEPEWTPPGTLLFTRSEQLLAVGLDLKSLRVTSAPEVVEVGLRSEPELTASLFSLSARGDLAYLPGGEVGKARRLVWIHRDGRREPWSGTAAAFVPDEADDSQDGRVIAVTILGPTGLFELWASETGEPALRRVLAYEAMDCDSPSVSPRGRFVAASCVGDAERNGIYLAEFPNVGARGRLVLPRGTARHYVTSWTPDGRGLFVRKLEGEKGSIELLPLDEDGTPGKVHEVPGLEGNIRWAAVSPDERLIAFTQWDGRGWSLQVATWDGAAAGPARPVMQDTSSGFDWTGVTRDGAHELALTDGESRYKFALIAPDGRVRRIEDMPPALEEAEDLLGQIFLSDGRILAIEADPAELSVRTVRLVTNWTETLNAR